MWVIAQEMKHLLGGREDNAMGRAWTWEPGCQGSNSGFATCKPQNVWHLSVPQPSHLLGEHLPITRIANIKTENTKIPSLGEEMG